MSSLIEPPLRVPVAAVVVTYNRAELLRECLTAVSAQSPAPERIYVVNNASSDDTLAVLDEFPLVCAITVPKNLGGAGGFALGIKAALAQSPAPGIAALWLLDDDTIPAPGALGALWDASQSFPGLTPAVVASRVLWTDGRDHPMNTPSPVPWLRRLSQRPLGTTRIRSASFVSVLISARSAREQGLPMAAYFLWNDDFEYTARLARGRVAIQCASSIVVHRTVSPGGSDADPGPRFYYEARNKLWLLRHSEAFPAWEKALYTLVTLRRWARMWRSSTDRSVLKAAWRRAWRDAKTPPTPTDELLAPFEALLAPSGQRSGPAAGAATEAGSR